MKIGLIGHSHVVCLLDAMGPWRDLMGITAATTVARPGFAKALDSWVSTGPKVVKMPARQIGKMTVDVAAVVVLAHADYDLIGKADVQGREITLRPTPTLALAAEAFKGYDLIISVTFGGEMTGLLWLDDLPPYDFIEETVPVPTRSGAQIIDRLYVKRVLDGKVSRVHMALSWLGNACRGSRIIHIMPPPPLENTSGLAHLEGFAGALREHGELDGTLRLKLYRAYLRQMIAALNPNGTAVMAPPPGAQTSSGYFRKDLAIGLTHGNVRYGAMNWEALAAGLGWAQ
ncbi:MAG TPA: hypothetical protein VGG27_01470 [Magnetospirillaceae bacterium]|jgi:hypothetical protein